MSFIKITGKQGSGKTTVANRLAEKYNNVIRYDYYDIALGCFSFSGCSEETDLIIFDCHNLKEHEMNVIEEMAEKGFLLCRPMKLSVMIKPDIIVIINKE